MWSQAKEVLKKVNLIVVRAKDTDLIQLFSFFLEELDFPLQK